LILRIPLLLEEDDFQLGENYMELEEEESEKSSSIEVEKEFMFELQRDKSSIDEFQDLQIEALTSRIPQDFDLPN